MGQKKDYLRLIIFTTIFAAAFGAIEAAAAHYLRLLYYPAGFSNVLKEINPHTAAVEIGREACTLAVMLSAAFLTARGFIRVFARFVYVFAVWDIVYYIGLFAFEGWPKGLLDWDILFLIPVPWLGPVLAPVLISLIGIAGALIVDWIYYSGKEVKSGPVPAALLSLALAFWLFTFTVHPDYSRFPKSYNWPVYIAGAASALAGYAFLLPRNRRKA